MYEGTSNSVLFQRQIQVSVQGVRTLCLFEKFANVMQNLDKNKKIIAWNPSFFLDISGSVPGLGQVFGLTEFIVFHYKVTTMSCF